MKKIAVATFTLLLSSCASVDVTRPAPIIVSPKVQIDGIVPPKVQILEMNQQARAILGAREKDDLIIRVGSDGTLTLFGAPGQGFRIEDRKVDMPSEKGVVNKFTVTTTKNSPVCDKIEIGGWVIWYSSPPCPVQ